LIQTVHSGPQGDAVPLTREQQLERPVYRRKEAMLGATVMVNRDPVGHIEVVREETRDKGEHLYRYKVYEQGSVLEYGVITHKESEGPYVLLHKALGAIIAGHLVDD